MHDAPHEPNHASPSWRIMAGLLLVLTLIAYYPALRSSFVWNDEDLTDNVVLRPGGIYKVWLAPVELYTTGTTQSKNYWPVTWTSYWMEYQLWGFFAPGYHLVNVLLHVAAAWVIWRILVRLGIPAAWLAALVFAVHPVNVESVAWITQRKNLLSMLFYVAAVWSYLRFDTRGGFWWYLLAVASFLLSMLGKGAAATMPLVLLMCAWWLHGRIRVYDVVRSIPFFVVAAFMSVLEIWFQYKQAIGDDVVRDDSFWARLAGAGWAVWFYLYKALVPINLSFVYPRWEIDPTRVLSYLPLAALLGVLAVAWFFRRGWGRPLLFALGYYVITLLPVLGFFDIYFMRYSLVADHYQYVSIISIIALVVAAVAQLVKRLAAVLNRGTPTAAENPLYYLAGAVLLVLAMLTWQQSRIYSNSGTLWADTIEKNPDSWLAHNNLGKWLMLRGKPEKGIEHFRRAIAIDPNDFEATYNLANAFSQQKKYEEALELCREAIRLDPNRAVAYNLLGITLHLQGNSEEAIPHFHQAIGIEPDFADAHVALAIVLASQGKLDEAETHYRRAIQGQPHHVRAISSLADLLKSQGRLDKQEALAIISGYRKALEFNPRDAAAHHNLAWILATHPDDAVRNGPEAVKHALIASKPTPNHPVVLNTLAAAYAEAGQFDQAVATAQKAMQVALGAGLMPLAQKTDALLQLYRAGKPYRETGATTPGAAGSPGGRTSSR